MRNYIKPIATLFLVSVTLGASGDELFQIDSARMAEIARSALWAQEPNLVDLELPVSSIFIMCIEPAGTGCIGAIELEISAHETVTKQGEHCTTRTTYTSMQVLVKPDGETHVTGKYSERNVGNRSRTSLCSPKIPEGVK